MFECHLRFERIFASKILTWAVAVTYDSRPIILWTIYDYRPITWQDHSKEICMIRMVPYYGQIMIGLVGKPGILFEIKYSNL